MTATLFDVQGETEKRELTWKVQRESNQVKRNGRIAMWISEKVGFKVEGIEQNEE